MRRENHRISASALVLAAAAIALLLGVLQWQSRALQAGLHGPTLYTPLYQPMPMHGAPLSVLRPSRTTLRELRERRLQRKNARLGRQQSGFLHFLTTLLARLLIP